MRQEARQAYGAAMRHALFSPLVALAALAGCSATPAEPEVSVEQAWVRLPAAPGRPGAAYFTLEANRLPMALANVSSPRVERIELHDMSMDGGVMRMGPLADRAFPPEAVIAFEPGGKHAMLFGIAPDVAPGGRLPLTFTFDNAPDVTVEAEVRSAGDSPAAD